LRAVLTVGFFLASVPAGARMPEETRKLVIDFPQKLAGIKSRQMELSRKWKSARKESEKAAIREIARDFVIRSITDDIIPAWMGTKWAWGHDDDASVPHQAGKRVSCSLFVTAVLQNVGLRLDHRPLWANARALYIQRTLAPKLSDLNYYHGLSPLNLGEKLAGLGDGLYAIGLNCHVGFLVVANKTARIIHSDYSDPETGVRSEQIATSQAILNSQQAGYWVTPLFHDDRLIEFWLGDRVVNLGYLGLPAAGEDSRLAEVQRRRKVIETGVP